MTAPRPLLAGLLVVLLVCSGLDSDARAENDPVAPRKAAAKAMAAGAAAREAGDLVKAQAKYEEAKALFTQAKDKRAGVADFLARSADMATQGNAAESAAMMINAGSIWFSLGRLKRAATTLQQGIAMAEVVDHKTWLGRGRAMLTQVYLAAGQPAEAVKVGTLAVGGLAGIPDPRGAAVATISVAKAHFSLQEHGKAATILERGLAYAEQAQFPAAVDMAVSWLAWTYYHLRDYKAARIWYVRDLKRRKAGHDERKIDEAYMNLGEILWELGDYDVLELHIEEALVRAGPDKRPALAAEMHMLLSRMAVVEGQQRLGLKQFEVAEKAFRAAGQEGRLPDVYRGMAKALSRMGRVEKALRYLQKSMRHADGEKQGRARLRAMIDMAGAHYRLGQFGEALDLAERSVPLARKLKDRANEGVAVGLLGTIHHALDDFDHALELQREALAIARAIGDKSREVIALGNVGTVLAARDDKDQGDLEAAMSAIDEALALARERKRDGSEVVFLGVRAKLLARMGRRKEAVTAARLALERAEVHADPFLALRARLAATRLEVRGEPNEEQLEELREIADDAHSYRAVQTEVEARRRITRALLNAGENRAALREAKAAAREVEGMYGGLGQALGASARSSVADLYQLGAIAAVRAGRPADAFRLLEQGRAGMLVGALRTRDLVDWSNLPDDLAGARDKARADVSRAQYRLSRASQRRDREASRNARRDLEKALGEQRAVADRVQRAAKRQADIAFPRVPPLREIQDSLEHDQALVILGLGEAQAIAVIVTADDERAVVIGTRDVILAAAEAFDPSDRSVDGTEALAALQKAVVEPLGLGKDIREVIVSPDGVLCQTPLPLLFAERRVALTPSATTYAYLAEEGRNLTGAKVLAMGDPLYRQGAGAAIASVYTRAGPRGRGSSRGLVRSSGSLMPLPATRPEVKAIGDVILLGKEATEAGFRSELVKQERWRAIHFACHGLVNPDAADLCALALTPVGKDDGFLTVFELLQMNIPTDLAVLSACETGRGQVSSGEGLLGLARSFVHAGALRVVCSLWKVDDAATKAFMVKFYALWNPKEGKGLPPAEALRQAQAHVKANPKWAHPYYWGAWVLWGLPR